MKMSGSLGFIHLSAAESLRKGAFASLRAKGILQRDCVSSALPGRDVFALPAGVSVPVPGSDTLLCQPVTQSVAASCQVAWLKTESFFFLGDSVLNAIVRLLQSL